MKQLINFFTLLFLLNLLACKKDNELKSDIKDPSINTPTSNTKYGSVTINFNNKAGSESLQLNIGNYLNANGDSFNVSKFKYYISNIVLKNADGTTFVEPECYHLIDNRKGNKYSLILDSVPVGPYNGISFILGVDSTRNTSGAS